MYLGLNVGAHFFPIVWFVLEKNVLYN